MLRNRQFAGQEANLGCVVQRELVQAGAPPCQHADNKGPLTALRSQGVFTVQWSNGFDKGGVLSD